MVLKGVFRNLHTLFYTVFSCAKSAGIADQRLEEFHDALIFKMEDSAYEGQGEI